MLDPLGRAEGSLGRRRIDRPKKNVVLAATFGRARGFQRMAGKPNVKIVTARRAAPLDDGGLRERFFPQVNGAGIRGQRHIQAVIDQNSRASYARYRHRKSSQLDQSARIEILVSNLNPVNSLCNGAANAILKRAG